MKKRKDLGKRKKTKKLLLEVKYMDESLFIDLFRQYFYKAFEIMMPSLLASLLIVLVVAVVMTVMSIQEQTLTFLPKLIGFVFVLALMGPWMFDSLITLIQDTWNRIPSLL